MFAFTHEGERRSVNAQVTIRTTNGLHQEKWQDELLQKGAAPGPIGVRTTAVRTVETTSKHD
jgi:hypothetical protein